MSKKEPHDAFAKSQVIFDSVPVAALLARR